MGNKKRQQYLAQMLFEYKGVSPNICINLAHRIPVNAEWEVRFFQDPQRTAELFRQGCSREQIARLAWDKMREQQDRQGVKTLKRAWLCSMCADQMIANFAGHLDGYIRTCGAVLNRKGILLAIERETEKTTASGDVPSGIADEEILAFIEAWGAPLDADQFIKQQKYQ